MDIEYLIKVPSLTSFENNIPFMIEQTPDFKSLFLSFSASFLDNYRVKYNYKLAGKGWSS
jgi:hypothetical protein